MFDRLPEERLTAWSNLRASIDLDLVTLEEVCKFWQPAPFVAYNPKIDPYHQKSWPTPWEIIVENKYDDFTKALMIGWTLKLTKKYSSSTIELRTLVDNQKPTVYNICCVDNEWALNYIDGVPSPINKLPDYFLLENIVELNALR